MKEDHLNREPECLTCGMPKAPHGRSVASAAINAYCHPSMCEGYNEPPVPSSLFRSEAAEPVADDSILLTRIEYEITFEGQVLAIASREMCESVAEYMPTGVIDNDSGLDVLGVEVLVMDRDQDGIRDLKRGDRYVVPKEEA